MALPQLYRSLTLTSYDKIRYRGEQPEGIGSASPFTMGLSAVITRPYATLVRSITLRGDWKETDIEEYAQVGRVPDSSMLLNIAVRAAVDRMTNLESFSWELNTKMLETVYIGLLKLPNLTSLTIRFPSTRQPQPTFVLPGMPNLRCLKITNIDPLCYPDDISTILLKSRKLRELKLHWSPRIRLEQEPSVSLRDYFRKCTAAKQPLSVKKLSFQNLYAFHSEEFNLSFDPTTVEDVTFLNGSDTVDLMNTFVENSWPTMMPDRKLKIKSMRMDTVSKRTSEFLGSFKGLERLYFVNMFDNCPDYLNSTRPGMGPGSAALTPPASDSPLTAASPASQLNVALSVRDSYLANITVNHGATLRHLLLCSKWPLSTAMIARLVHSCPNLEQLALPTDFSSMDSLGMLVPFLRKLVALRLLIPTGSPAPQSGVDANAPLSATSTHPVDANLKSTVPNAAVNPHWVAKTKQYQFPKEIETILLNARSLADIVDLDDDILIRKMSYDLADHEIFGNVKVVGMGWKAFELRDLCKAPLPQHTNSETQSPTSAVDHPHSTADEQSWPSNGVNGHVGTDFGSLQQPAATPSKSSAANMPYSTLRKRTRDNDNDIHPPVSLASETAPASNHPCRDSNTADYGHLPPVLTNDGSGYRRHIRRVGWDFLQNWEIWALDAQEI